MQKAWVCFYHKGQKYRQYCIGGKKKAPRFFAEPMVVCPVFWDKNKRYGFSKDRKKNDRVGEARPVTLYFSLKVLVPTRKPLL